MSEQMLTRRWDDMGFWRYSCGCIQYQDGSDRCKDHASGLPLARSLYSKIEKSEQPLVGKIKLCMPTARMPVYGTHGAAGMDIASAENLTVRAGALVSIRTGIIIEPPEGYFWTVFARSSLCRRGLMLANSVGIIDPDYCGPEDECKLPLFNFGTQPAKIEIGDRLAQIIFLPCIKVFLKEGEMTSKTRGGFGSTGVK